jgi:hypothetical protein
MSKTEFYELMLIIFSLSSLQADRGCGRIILLQFTKKFFHSQICFFTSPNCSASRILSKFQNWLNIRCSFACVQLVGAASYNKPTLREGRRQHVSAGRSRLPTRLEAYWGDFLWKRKKHHCGCVVCTIMRVEE